MVIDQQSRPYRPAYVRVRSHRRDRLPMPAARGKKPACDLLVCGEHTIGAASTSHTRPMRARREVTSARLQSRSRRYRTSEAAARPKCSAVGGGGVTVELKTCNSQCPDTMTVDSPLPSQKLVC
jgi:hypothetical protein